MKTTLSQEHLVQAGDGHIYCTIEKSQVRFKKVRDSEGGDTLLGEFFILLNILALQETVYVPISIASGKKPTGLVYHIEGTAEGKLSTTNISCRGEGVSSVTLGTLLYAKIPPTKTATLRILIEMRGKPGKEYKIVINRINYKLDASDARYKKFETSLGTETLKFR